MTKIKFFLDKPQCITPMQTIPANVGSLVTMICDVEANPANVTFFWQSKHKDLRDLRGQSSFRQMSHHVHITDRAMKSRLEIQIESGDNFGQYLCYAQNLAGVQDEPCFYNVYGKFFSTGKVIWQFMQYCVMEATIGWLFDFWCVIFTVCFSLDVTTQWEKS